MQSAGRWFASRHRLFWLAVLAACLCATSSATAQPGASYELAARITFSHGAVAEAAWLDSDRYLTLVIGPQGAEVYLHSYSESSRERFMSTEFMATHVCTPELAGRLSWTLSPGRRYLFFHWFTDDGRRRWTLFDISGAPSFKLKRFSPPPGMVIERALFSPDDRYVVFTHDAVQGSSDVSVLVLDLESGTEYWRIGSQQLNFISQLWWGSAIYDNPRCYAAAKLSDSQFLSYPGLARLDLAAKQLSFTAGESAVICGAEALWGQVLSYATGAGGAPYSLEAQIAGENKPREIPLSAEPVGIFALPTPGRLLLSNTADWITNQLWLVDGFSGDKYLIDPDCAGFSVAEDGKLLVRAGTKIELRIYETAAEETEPQAPPVG